MFDKMFLYYNSNDRLEEIMQILNRKVSLEELKADEEYFEDMSKAVVDIHKELIAVHASLHSDLESLLLENGSAQKDLYGINLLFDDKEIEYDSLINPPRNRDAGYPRAGRTVADPKARAEIEKVVAKWIAM